VGNGYENEGFEVRQASQWTDKAMLAGRLEIGCIMVIESVHLLYDC